MIVPIRKKTWRASGGMLILINFALMLFNVGCSQQQPQGDNEMPQNKLFYPKVDNVPVSVRHLKPNEKAKFLEAVEKKVQENFPNAKCSCQPDESSSPVWTVYQIETDKGLISLDIFFGDSAKTAAQTLQAMDLTVSVRETIQDIPGIGDEAFQYGPNGMLLARYSNILIKVSSTDSSRRQHAANLVVNAINEIVKDESTL